MLAAIVTVMLFVAVAHYPFVVALPVTMAFGFTARLLPTPLIPAPVVASPLISAIVPTAVVPVTVVMGQQWRRLLIGDVGQA